MSRFLWFTVYVAKRTRNAFCGMHRRSQGRLQLVHLHPQGGGKMFFKRNLQGKCVSAAQPEQESILGHLLLGGLDLEVYLDCLLRATTKKVVNFLTKKVHPRQNPGYVYGGTWYLPHSHVYNERTVPW